MIKHLFITVLATFLLFPNVNHAFVIERNVLNLLASPPTTNHLQRTTRTIQTIHHAKKRTTGKQPIVEGKTKQGVDYGFVLQQFLNPGNPYSWFLYFFIGIYALDAINSQ